MQVFFIRLILTIIFILGSCLMSYSIFSHGLDILLTEHNNLNSKINENLELMTKKVSVLDYHQHKTYFLNFFSYISTIVTVCIATFLFISVLKGETTNIETFVNMIVSEQTQRTNNLILGLKDYYEKIHTPLNINGVIDNLNVNQENPKLVDLDIFDR